MIVDRWVTLTQDQTGNYEAVSARDPQEINTFR